MIAETPLGRMKLTTLTWGRGRIVAEIGRDPSRWKPGVPNNGRIRYGEVYAGIDAVLYSGGHALEYDFVVAAGADPSMIRLRFEGQKQLDVDASGEVVLRTSSGTVRHALPRVFQKSGLDLRHVSARYKLLPNGEVGFELGSYDRSIPIVIDPGVIYSKFIGGSGSELSTAVATNAAGEVYVAGVTDSADFPVVSGAFDSTLGEPRDVFISRLSADGSSLLASTFIGGENDDLLRNIAVDAVGTVYATGTTYSTAFPTTSGAYDTSANGLGDIFVLRLSADGSSLLFSTLVGGSQADGAGSLAIDDSGAVFVTGNTLSANYPTSGGAYDTTFNGEWDVVVTKLSASGASLVYSTFIGSDNDELGESIALDSAGAAVVTGTTFSFTYPVTPGAHDTQFGSAAAGFVTKLGLDGSSLAFSTFVGGNDGDVCHAVDVAPSGAVYVTGMTYSTDFPVTAGAYDSTPDNFTGDAFALGLTSDGSSVVAATFLGGTSVDEGFGISVDTLGTIYVVGQTSSANFPTTVAAADASYGGGKDAFVARLSEGANSLLYSTFQGGAAEDSGNDLTFDALGNVYVAGGTVSADYPSSGFGVHAQASAFVTKLRLPGVETPGAYIVDSAAWFLRNTNDAGVADITFTYGPPGTAWKSVSGDWDGNGTDSPGLFDPVAGAFFLRTSNSAGPATLVFTFGPPNSGWRPVVGDWDGDGVDTVGLYDPVAGAFFLRNVNEPGPADLVFGYGPAGSGWTAVAGDWDGDDTVGLYDPAAGAFFLRDQNTPGPASVVVAYGPPSATPIVGDWNGDGITTVGVFIAATGAWFLRNSNTPGPADVTFTYGPASASPVAGDWDGFEARARLRSRRCNQFAVATLLPVPELGSAAQDVIDTGREARLRRDEEAEAAGLRGRSHSAQHLRRRAGRPARLGVGIRVVGGGVRNDKSAEDATTPRELGELFALQRKKRSK